MSGLIRFLEIGCRHVWAVLSARAQFSISKLVCAGCLALALALPAPTAWAGNDQIAVFYPDIGPPYRGIFEEMVKGVEDKLGRDIYSYPVRSTTDTDDLRNNLTSQHTGVIIALGRQGLKSANMVNGDIRLVVGGVMTVPDEDARKQPVISLTPDPELLFRHMKNLRPGTKRVFAVYNPAYNSWVMKLAGKAAKSLGLELVLLEAQDVRTAVQHYKKIFDEADSKRDTVWLPQDPTSVEESSVLPLILQKSWSKGVAVFSSNFNHVRRGVLFSLFPDNIGLGGSLAVLAQDILESKNKKVEGIYPLRDVVSVGNQRTAKHLGIDGGDFDMSVPQ